MPFALDYFISHKENITQFDTPYFLLFLITAVLLYHIFHRPKILLFISSYLFYASFSVELSFFVLVLSTINYVLGITLYKYRSRILLGAGIVLNLSALAYFKYFNFILLNFYKVKLITAYKPVSDILLPLGISFFMFEFIHYIVDVYKNQAPVKSLLDFYIFSFFFPTQIAGPIKRFEKFVPQLKNTKLDYALVSHGIDLIVLGLFKKLVLANALSVLATGYFTDVYTSHNVLGIYAFCFQIYFDFSGYSDIGRGAAALFNLKVPSNFSSPYLSTSIPEFWKRWHITLMNWMRDYIYIHLGGSRKGKLRRALNIIIVFSVSGLWHGAAYHFILWGLYNALLMIISIFLMPSRLLSFLPKKVSGLICWFTTFHLITFGWILFRAQSNYDVKMIIHRLVSSAPEISINQDILYIVILLCLYGIAGQWLLYIKPFKKVHAMSRYVAYSIAGTLIVLNLNINVVPFIYFQF